MPGFKLPIRKFYSFEERSFVKDITVEELFEINNPVVIDIRAPIEYKEGAIPGAVNIPLFTDEERQEIGTIYKQIGQEQAKWRAMELVSPKIPVLLQSIKDAAGKTHEQPIIHCWRGGMRSKAVLTFLEFAGVRAKRLEGGYKAYRQFILKEIPKLIPGKAVVIHGLTGVGKTEILQILENRGFPVLDLEGMANHRGSIFGGVGLGYGHNQKQFDSLLFKKLREIKGATYFLMEAESKRIGKVTQLDELMVKKMNGINFHVHSSIEQRVRHIAKDYIDPYETESWYYEVINDALDKVFRRLKGEDNIRILEENLVNREYKKMIQVLLEKYYDPMYDYKRQEYAGDFYDIFAENPLDAANQIAVQLAQLSLKPQYV
jgi:tRNA 2-selenouridine synthase